jgi:3-phosphoshikimate 1-carboxyvinyltransferase
MGVGVIEDRDSLSIMGMKTPKPAAESQDDDEEKKEEPAEEVREPVVIDSYADHRIAMAFGILGTAVGGITIEGAECVAKTYPSFWDTMKTVGVDFSKSE